MRELKSIWDGWTKQCFFSADNQKGETCAVGYPRYSIKGNETFQRVGAYIRTHYNVPLQYNYKPAAANYCSYVRGIFDNWDVVVWANNVLKLTPEQFREIDYKTQIAAITEPLVVSSDGALDFIPEGIDVYVPVC